MSAVIIIMVSWKIICIQCFYYSTRGQENLKGLNSLPGKELASEEARSYLTRGIVDYI